MHKITNKKGIIYCLGSLSKYGSKEAKGTDSYLSIRQSIEELEASAAVDQIMLYCDSPGGAVDGLFDTADAIKNATKPTSAFISGCGCSAAYLLTSQCNTVYAEQGSMVGSIGVLKVLEDTTKQMEMAGIKNIVVSSGEKKGRLVPGSEISSSDIDSIKAKVQFFADKFLGYVKEGRKMNQDQINKIKDGDSYIAEEAIDYGLIDSLVKYTDFVAGNTNMKKDEIKAEVIEEEKKDEKPEIEATEDVAEPALSEVDQLKQIIEELKKEIEELKKEEVVEEEEEEVVAEEVEEEKKDEEVEEDEMSASVKYQKADTNLVDLMMVATGNDRELVFEAMQKGWTVEQTVKAAEAKKTIKQLKSYDKVDTDILAKLKGYCENEADAKALADFYESERKNK